VISGDMLAAPLPSGYDVHLFSNVLHDWPDATVKELVRKSFSALSSDGMILIHDSHINRKKTGPLAVAAYSVLLMASAEGKCYSIAEIEEFLREAGFSDVQFRETIADRSVITARKTGRARAIKR
jgi:O-methyltransferase domain